MRRAIALSLLLNACATAPHPPDAVHSQRCVMAIDGDAGEPVLVCYAVETCSEPE